MLLYVTIHVSGNRGLTAGWKAGWDPVMGVVPRPPGGSLHMNHLSLAVPSLLSASQGPGCPLPWLLSVAGPLRPTLGE